MLGRRRIIQAGTAAALSGAFGRARAVTPHDEATLAVDREPQGQIDPAYRLGALEGNILRAVCPGLIAYRPGSFEWQPALARRIEQVRDTRIDFELRPGLVFHDGQPLTADDVKFSFERFQAQGPGGEPSPYARDWLALEEVEVTGPLTGRIHLSDLAPALWTTTLPDVSGCIISRRALEAGAYRTDTRPVRVIGAGAYRFAAWAPGEPAVLEAARGAGGAPPLRRLALRATPDAAAIERALAADEVQFAPADPTRIGSLAATPGVRTLKQNAINMVWLGINVERPPFSDPRVREAIRAAIDVEQVVAAAYEGAAVRADAPIAPGLLGYWRDAPRRQREVPLARKLLADSGHAGGLQARLTFLDEPPYRKAVALLQAQLAEAGIRIGPEPLGQASFWSAGRGDRGRALELSLQRFGGKADPSFQMQWFTASQVGAWNWQRWKDPEFDVLLEEAADTDDGDERSRLYIDAQKRMDHSAAFIWLTHEVSAYAFRDWLRPSVLPNGDDLQFDLFAAA